MKTDYYTLGKRARQILRQTTTRAFEVQRGQLEHILQENANTAYGKKYDFSSIHSQEAFQDKVPVSEYRDVQPFIEKAMEGKGAQLTQADPVYYAITSGSTGTPKYVPVTREDMELHYRSIYGGVFGMVQEYYPGVPQEQLFGKILETGEFAKTTLPGGQLCGIRSASLYQWLDRDGDFDASDYCVPKEILFPESLEDLIYLKARFALAERNITAIHSIFLHRVVHLMEYIQENWELLLHDMEQGTISSRVPLAARWKEKTEHWLPPDPLRAAELRELDIPQHPEGMIQKLWPRARYIVGIGGATFPQYTKRVRSYAPDLPIHPFIYGASEGFLSIAAEMNRPDAYILLPEAGFFEFFPLSGNNKGQANPLTIEGLEVGKRYELIFTNHSGLYRYRMQDVLEVVDFYGQAPVVRFCYRKNQALNVADEKLNTEQLQDAFARFEKQIHRSGVAFCAQEDFTTRPGRYLFYLESEPLPGVSEVLDRCLAGASLGYSGCRSMGEIAPVQVRFVPPGSFHRYEELLAESGRTMAQYKPVRILQSELSKQFFAAQADGYEGREMP